MSIRVLIKTLQKEVKKSDRENSQLEFWVNEQEYEIDTMSGFSFSPNIVFSLKKINSSIIKPLSKRVGRTNTPYFFKK